MKATASQRNSASGDWYRQGETSGAIIHPRFRAREERKKLTTENVIPKIADCNRDCTHAHIVTAQLA